MGHWNTVESGFYETGYYENSAIMKSNFGTNFFSLRFPSNWVRLLWNRLLWNFGFYEIFLWNHRALSSAIMKLVCVLACYETFVCDHCSRTCLHTRWDVVTKAQWHSERYKTGTHLSMMSYCLLIKHWLSILPMIIPCLWVASLVIYKPQTIVRLHNQSLSTTMLTATSQHCVIRSTTLAKVWLEVEKNAYWLF
jgi:hypothetical protein